LLKSILAATLFPITLVGAAVGAYWLNQSHGYSSEAAAAATTIAAGLWIWVWEFILPYRKEWNKADSDLATDAIHLSITAIMTKFIKPLYVFLLIPAVGYLGARYGSDELWPHHWNLVGQLALMLVICAVAVAISCGAPQPQQAVLVKCRPFPPSGANVFTDT
jgi:hypothetical protein